MTPSIPPAPITFDEITDCGCSEVEFGELKSNDSRDLKNLMISLLKKKICSLLCFYCFYLPGR